MSWIAPAGFHFSTSKYYEEPRQHGVFGESFVGECTVLIISNSVIYRYKSWHISMCRTFYMSSLWFQQTSTVLDWIPLMQCRVSANHLRSWYNEWDVINSLRTSRLSIRWTTTQLHLKLENIHSRSRDEFARLARTGPDKFAFSCN